MAMKIAPCPNCGGNQLFQSEPLSAGGGHAPDYLPGLGSFLRPEKFILVLCRDCGLTRWFARGEALPKLGETTKWHRV